MPFDEGYETGPFCRHYSDPSDCELNCVTCGHRCTDHDIADGDCFRCECKLYKDPEDEQENSPLL